MVFGERDNYHDAFPIYHCHPTNPPHLLINGNVDYSLKRHTLDYCFALREQGVYVKVFIAPSQSHFTVRKDWRTTNRYTLKHIIKFITEVVQYNNYKENI